VTAQQVQTAHGDAWQELGRIHSARGGAIVLPGVRLMASGLPHPQWNNGDVSDPDAVDIEAVARWFEERSVPWGLRVPNALSWRRGRLLFRKRLMGLVPEAFGPADVPPDVDVRAAEGSDFDSLVAVDSVAFESEPGLERGWLEPLLNADAAVVAVATIAGETVGTGYAVVTTGEAGCSTYVAGIGVLPQWRRRGIGAAVSSWLVTQGLDRGAGLAHLHPDTDEAAAIYARLGFVEVDGFGVYVDNA
jgi:GNAT superfamily N-acetyltransferase